LMVAIWLLEITAVSFVAAIRILEALCCFSW
jgi:hypothetical protein